MLQTWWVGDSHTNVTQIRVNRFARKNLFLKHLARFARIASSLRFSHSNSRDSRPILAAIHFLEGRFVKNLFFSKREPIRREYSCESRVNRESICANRPTKVTEFPRKRWESAKVSHKRVFALLTPEIHSYEMAQMLQKPVFALPGCQRTSVNTLLCDTLALAEKSVN